MARASHTRLSIVDTRVNNDENIEFLVEWMHYTYVVTLALVRFEFFRQDEATWEPVGNLNNADQALDDFFRRVAKQQ